MSFITSLRALSAVALGTALGAGQGTPPPKPSPAAAQADEALNPAFRSRIFTLQHRAPSQLRGLLMPLLSGARGSMIETLDRDGLQALSVRDFPENVAAIEEAVKRLDVGSPVRKQVEFHIHVLFASKEAGADGAVPEELKDVLASLRNTLNYRSYAQVATFVQRAADGADVVEGRGFADLADRGGKGVAQTMPLDLEWGIYHLALTSTDGAAPTITFPKFQLRAIEHVPGGTVSRASLETNLSMKDGEKVVVGTSMIKDKALIVVLTARIVD